MKVTIAPDFQSLLPEHSPQELAQLERNVLADPEHTLLPPIVVWSNHHNTIIDGHHQYQLREKHRLKTKFQKRIFHTRQDAEQAALEIQLGRRNLSASQMAMLLAKLPANSHGGDRSEDANLPLDRKTLAEKHGVSPRSITTAAKVRKQAAPAVVKAVEDGKVAVSDAAAVAERPKAEQAKAVKAVESGKAKTLREAVGFNPPPIKELSVEERMAEWNRQVESFARSITALSANAPQGGWWDESQANITAQQLKSAAGSARQAKCDNICPLCKGRKCKRCKNTGFMPRRTYEMAGGK